MADDPVHWAMAMQAALQADAQPATRPVHIAVLVPAGLASPLHGARLAGTPPPTYEEVMYRMAERVGWVDPTIHLDLFTDDMLGTPARVAEMQRADVLVAAGLADPAVAQQVEALAAPLRNVVALGCAPGLTTRVVPRGTSADLLGRIIAFFRPPPAEALKASLQRFWTGYNSEDLMNLFLVLVQAVVRDVEAVKYVIEASSIPAVTCMVSKCREPIMNCIGDETCKAGLDCLDKCDRRDQVCNYRCIASYESPAMEAFSLCIMQKHNCFGCQAAIPTVPDPTPLATFRGAPVTHEVAESILIGAGNAEGTGGASWRVVMGMNPAYDAFPCQNQLFYRGRGQVMWYDPVFQVPLPDGRKLWRRRHYRVARRDTPGTFRFSVLDNGITTTEHWRILEAAEDLSWSLLFYQGAASAAGQSYIGALLLTPSGAWPEDVAAVAGAFERHNLRLWEMQVVDNAHCAGAPL